MRKKFAQMPPAPMPPAGPPMPDPMGGMGMPPMPGAMPMGAPVGPPPPGEGPVREEIGSPLDSLAKILYDYDITDIVQSSSGKDAEELAMEVWEAYGGDKTGNALPDHTGRRHKQKNVDPQIEEQERDATDETKWERLPAGKSISDITSLDELTKLMNGFVFGTVKNMAKQQGGGAPPGGPMGMPMASTKAVIKLAAMLDEVKCHEQSDYIIAKAFK